MSMTEALTNGYEGPKESYLACSHQGLCIWETIWGL